MATFTALPTPCCSKKCEEDIVGMALCRQTFALVCGFFPAESMHDQVCRLYVGYSEMSSASAGTVQPTRVYPAIFMSMCVRAGMSEPWLVRETVARYSVCRLSPAHISEKMGVRVLSAWAMREAGLQYFTHVRACSARAYDLNAFSALTCAYICIQHGSSIARSQSPCLPSSRLPWPLCTRARLAHCDAGLPPQQGGEDRLRGGAYAARGESAALPLPHRLLRCVQESLLPRDERM